MREAKPLGLSKSAAVFLTITTLLVGATLAQAAALAATLVFSRSNLPANAQGVAGIWFFVNMLAVFLGIAGTYRALRRGSEARRMILAYFLVYSIALRYETVSLGWPFQLHLGLALGRGGIGVNLVGVAMAIWWFTLKTIEAARADATDSVARAVATTPGMEANSNIPAATTEPLSP